ncbi:hypothetical protein [Oceanobacillus rekensis]|uniref:hypothetical protein n=1 Tax=Oceanobacillus rekensis TaxID=937927 RepID=UPI000B44BC86|nr:hypothetical protein [Oceanobacillus rekensis]
MKTKKLYFLLMSALFLVVLTACGGTTENEEGTETEESGADGTDGSVEESDEVENNEEAETENSTPADDQDEETESVEEADEEIAESENGDGAAEIIKEEVTYSGQGDPHTIEVETDKGTMALQITEFMDDDWASLEPGTRMTIEYYENDMSQLMLVDYTVE